MQIAPFLVESAARTHQGKVRHHNEDSYCAREGDGLWAVADGMGGHEGGEWASGRLVEGLEALVLPEDIDAACPLVKEAIVSANRDILAEGQRRGRSMGSTIVVLLVRGDRYAVIWVGDSRAYVLRGGGLVQLSRDHSQVQDMVARGLLKPEDAIGHPMGHILSRAIGVREEVAVDQETGEVQAGDIFLLCSDGLHGSVGADGIARRLARGDPDRACEELVEITLANGAPDNVTVVAVAVREPTLLSL